VRRVRVLWGDRHFMRTLRTLVLLALVAGVSPRSASADWFLTPFYGLKFGGQTSLVDLESGAGTTKQVFGGSISFMGAGILGVEADVGYIPGYFQRDQGFLVVDSSLITVMGSVVVATPLSWTRESLRPYIVGGIGLMRAYSDDTFNALRVNDNLLAIDVGGGVMGFVNDRTGVRFELRYFSSVGQPEVEASFGSARLSYWRASVGLVLKRALF
jgi:hypothetical protein